MDDIIDAGTIKKCAIIGSGTLGARIGLQAALSGYHVTLYDHDEKAFTLADKDYERIRHMLVRQGQITHVDFTEKVASMKRTTRLQEACEGADFVSESVYEDVAIKKKVWGDMAGLLPDHCVLTTNTSYLLPSQFAAESGAPERFCAFHFHDVFTARVVDIMPHQGTDSKIVDALRILGKKLNQIPIVIHKETNGYIFNKLFGNVLLQSGMMLADGIGSIEDIDRSWMGNFGMKIGPFGMMDEVGLDTLLKVLQNWKIPGKEGFVQLLEQKINEGKLGIKSGEGFYTYPVPGYKSKDFL